MVACFMTLIIPCPSWGLSFTLCTMGREILSSRSLISPSLQYSSFLFLQDHVRAQNTQIPWKGEGHGNIPGSGWTWPAWTANV